MAKQIKELSTIQANSGTIKKKQPHNSQQKRHRASLGFLEIEGATPRGVQIVILMLHIHNQIQGQTNAERHLRYTSFTQP